MAWVAVDKNGGEYVSEDRPKRIAEFGVWDNSVRIGCYEEHYYDEKVLLPQGSIFKLIGRELSWEDDAVKLK